MSDVEAEIAGIEQVLADRPSEYFRDQAMQARYGELIQAQEYGTHPHSVGRNEARMAELEKMMAAPGNSSEYWHSPALQDEYKALLEAREAAPTDTGPDMAEALGLSPEAAQEVDERVAQAFAGLDTRDLDTAWLGLSEDAQLAFGRVLADPSTTLASKESVADFRQQIGEPTFQEVLNFEQAMTTEERAALKRACRVA